MSIKTEKITIEDLINKVKTYDDHEEDTKLIRNAYDYAYKKHFSQKRITGDDYITHPLNVAWILTDVSADSSAIAAALLHDTIDDSDSLEGMLAIYVSYTVRATNSKDNLVYPLYL